MEDARLNWKKVGIRKREIDCLGHSWPNSDFKWRAPWVTTVKVLMSCGQRCWVPLVGITGYVSYAPTLVVRQLGGMQFVPRTMGIA